MSHHNSLITKTVSSWYFMLVYLLYVVLSNPKKSVTEEKRKEMLQVTHVCKPSFPSSGPFYHSACSSLNFRNELLYLLLGSFQR